MKLIKICYQKLISLHGHLYICITDTCTLHEGLNYDIGKITILWYITCSFHPGAGLTNFNDGGGGGGVRKRFIFYTQKNHNFRIWLSKKITTFFSIPKKFPLFFFRDPKTSQCLSYTQKITFGQNFRPKKNLGSPPPPPPPSPSLKYVSEAPGELVYKPKMQN